MVLNDNDIPLIAMETLQYRLDTQNFGKSGGQRSSLTRCAQKFGTFRAELLSSSSKIATPDNDNNDDTNTAEINTIEKSKNDVVREVELFDLELTKLILWQHNLERQAKRNKVIEAERNENIQAMQQQVRDSKILANQSLEQKNCLSEYESLSRVINENHPTSSTELQNEIDEIRIVLSTLEEASAKKDEIIKVREAQYQLLIQYMMDLKQSLKEDDDQEDGNGQGGDPMDIDNLYGDL